MATATEQGYEFTEADAAAWIEKRQGERQDRELSDNELETVAGGKGDGMFDVERNTEGAMEGLADNVGSKIDWFGDGIDKAGKDAAAHDSPFDWVGSWF